MIVLVWSLLGSWNASQQPPSLIYFPGRPLKNWVDVCNVKMCVDTHVHHSCHPISLASRCLNLNQRHLPSYWSNSPLLSISYCFHSPTRFHYHLAVPQTARCSHIHIWPSNSSPAAEGKSQLHIGRGHASPFIRVFFVNAEGASYCFRRPTGKRKHFLNVQGANADSPQYPSQKWSLHALCREPLSWLSLLCSIDFAGSSFFSCWGPASVVDEPWLLNPGKLLNPGLFGVGGMIFLIMSLSNPQCQ